MNLKPLFSILCLSVMVSCSSDDDSNAVAAPVTGDFFPSTVDDTWIYSVENTSTTNPELDFSATDLVTVNSSNGNSYTIEVNNGTSLPNGTMNSILRSGTLTKSDSTLEFDGELPLLDQLDLITSPNAILTDFVVYDLNAATNDEIASVNDTVSEDIEIDGTTIPITITYTIINKKLTNLSTLEVDGEIYSSVIRTEITLNMAVDATINILGSPTTQSFLESQNVLTITNYFAEDVGLIKSEANQSFMINQTLIDILEAAGVTIDFPTSASVDNVQELDSYVISGN